MVWKFLNTGLRSGKFNMDYDQLLARKLKECLGFPTLRVYGWKPYAISFGSNQDRSGFDASKLQRDGIDLVQRPTGGRAILHAHELTYSVVLINEGKSPREIYYSISQGLLCGLHLLGIEAQLTRNDDNFRELYQNNSSIPCFASSAKYEIQFQGKKLVGSAQHRYSKVVLQHGSLLLGPQHQNISNYLTKNIQNEKTLIDNILLSKTIDAESILGRSITFDETAECIKKGFENAWNIKFSEDSINSQETSL